MRKEFLGLEFHPDGSYSVNPQAVHKLNPEYGTLTLGLAGGISKEDGSFTQGGLHLGLLEMSLDRTSQEFDSTRMRTWLSTALTSGEKAKFLAGGELDQIHGFRFVKDFRDVCAPTLLGGYTGEFYAGNRSNRNGIKIKFMGQGGGGIVCHKDKLLLVGGILGQGGVNIGMHGIPLAIPPNDQNPSTPGILGVGLKGVLQVILEDQFRAYLEGGPGFGGVPGKTQDHGIKTGAEVSLHLPDTILEVPLVLGADVSYRSQKGEVDSKKVGRKSGSIRSTEILGHVGFGFN